MSEPVISGGPIHVRRFSLALTAAAIIAPLISLVGWLTGMPLLASYGAQFIPMAPSTAICFTLLSLPLLIALRPAHGPMGNPGIVLSGGLVAVYGFLVTFGWVTGLPLNPDDLLFAEMGTLGPHPVGRMAPATGVLFLISGGSLIALTGGLSQKKGTDRYLSLATFSGALISITGAVFSLGYALGAPLLYESGAIPLALPTAVSFLLLGGALTTVAVFYNPVSSRWHRRLNDMRIGTQLRLGLGVILAFVVLLGALTWRTTDLIWLQSKRFYDHPHQVHRAADKLEIEVELMSRYVRDLFLAQNDPEIEAALQGIEIGKAAAERQFLILFERYLGPREDVITLREEFIKWNTLRVETVRLFRMGKSSEAEARIRPGGIQDVQATGVRLRLGKIENFAWNKGDEIHQATTEQKDTLNRQVTLIVVAILLLSLIVSLLLQNGIKTPLLKLTEAAEQFREGKRDIRSGYVSANEFGVLSAAFDTMADTVETQTRINEQAALLAGIMLRETEASAFCRELLKALVGFTGSRIGAVYLLNPRKTEFEQYESIGLSSSGRTSFSASSPEGEFGFALATGRMQRITDIPGETRFTFASVSGEFRPMEIITIPLQAGQETVAVISLASVHNYHENAIRLLEGILSTLTARMNGVLAFRQIRELAEKLDRQNTELSAQSQELIAQSREMTQQNTELTMQKEQLDEANRLKNTFLSNMSHELRTPLNSVIALSGVLRHRLTGMIPDEEYGYLEVIERNGRHLLELINDILDLSRLEAGREEIGLTRFSIRMLAGEVVEMIEPQAREKNITLVNLVEDDLPFVTSDSGKVRHILQNLVGNAVKFTGTGSVEIFARLLDNQIHVAVRDTGIGIDPGHLSHIFDEFRQADESTSRKYGGTGLGLSIARKYATLLNGGITVESTPGRGSTFTLRLPLTLSPNNDGVIATEEPGNDSGPVTARSTIATGREQSILLVEDNAPAVIQLTGILTGQGYRVRVARNGREALSQIDDSLPDAVILDLMMPEMDGFEVLRTIRGVERTASLPVLILTAKHVTREELSFLKGNHIYQLIQKGDVGKTELLDAVARMVVAPQEKSATATRPRVCKRRSGKPVILVVEDNPDNLRTARALLEDNFQVVEALDGRAGVEQARRHQPDLILMDLSLPVMDGFEALAEIRENEALRHIPVVAVTASAMKGDREAVLARGFDRYISKPIDAELLRNTLDEVLCGNE
ncbi:MAG: response regulator [Pseudomonadota bacterium]